MPLNPQGAEQHFQTTNLVYRLGLQKLEPSYLVRKDYTTSVSIFGRSLANAPFAVDPMRIGAARISRAVARTVQRHTSGYAAPEALYAVGMRISEASRSLRGRSISGTDQARARSLSLSPNSVRPDASVPTVVRASFVPAGR